MKKKISNEVKIGIAAIISLVLLYIGVNYLKGVNMFKPTNYYYVACPNARDITISSPVYVEGFKVGLVRNIEYDYSTVNKITLELYLDKGMRINKGSYVSIESTLFSGAELHLVLNEYVTEYCQRGDTIEGRLKTGMTTSVEEDIIPQFNVMMPKIDSILTGLQRLVNSNELQLSLANLEHTTANLAKTSQRLDNLLRTDVPEIMSGLKTTATNLLEFSADIKQLDFNHTIATLNTSLDNINEMSLKLNSKTNSLGLLLNDASLYNNLNSTLDNASNLLIDIRQNPKKYVKLSLF